MITVELNGEGFKLLVKQGEKVKRGQKLIEFDLNKIKEKGYDPTTMLLVTEANNKTLKKETYRSVENEDKVLELIGEGA